MKNEEENMLLCLSCLIFFFPVILSFTPKYLVSRFKINLCALCRFAVLC